MLQLNNPNSLPLTARITQTCATLNFTQEAKDTYAELACALPFAPTGDEYVFFPACCYNGNRFDVLKKPYPPMFSADEASPDMPVTITDVPRLEKNGNGKIEVTTGDVSVPCVGVFSHAEKQAVLLFTIQQVSGVNLGLSYEKGKIAISYPHMRTEKIYRWPFTKPGHDRGMDFSAGQTVEIPYKLFCFPCESMEVFFDVFFKNRKCMGLDDTRPAVLPAHEQFEIQRDKFNAMNWCEAGGFYGVGVNEDDGTQLWQPGWVGGGMSGYALMKLGGPREWDRAVKTLYHLFRTQGESGFFYGETDAYGVPVQNFTGCDLHLIRESGDVLLFLCKHFNFMQEKQAEIPQALRNGTKKLADAFVTLWERYGQFGQFVNVHTGEIFAGGSTSAGIAPAGLVAAYRFFGDKRYLNVAKAAAAQYYIRDAAHGYTTGGPGEILQCPDSESAAGLLESLVWLYDETAEKIWLRRAEHMAKLCASWVVSYNYDFPPESEFGRLKMKTVGSVFANAQNKHSAPGICTLSGDSLYKLYTWTQNELYLALLKDIALTISQYISTDARPIYSWDVPKDASLLQDDSIVVPREKLPQGFICERVNMSDWESARCVGGVFNGSCWPETSNLLTLAELTLTGPLAEQ